MLFFLIIAISIVKIQHLLLNSSFLQRTERGFQYTNTQSDSVQITDVKKGMLYEFKEFLLEKFK